MVDIVQIGVIGGTIAAGLYYGYQLLSDSGGEDELDVEHIETVAEDHIRELITDLGHPMTGTYLKRDGVKLGRVSHVAHLGQPVSEDRMKDLDLSDEDLPDTDDWNLYGFITGPTGWISYAVLTRIPFYDAKKTWLISPDNIEDPSTTRHFEIGSHTHLSKKPGGVYRDSSIESDAAVNEVFSSRREEAILAGLEGYTNRVVTLDAGTMSNIKQELEKLKAEARKWQDRTEDEV